MKRTCFWALLIITMLAFSANADAKRAANFPYVKSDLDGFFYARCIPAKVEGRDGVTEIYHVKSDKDELVDRYTWYSKQGLFLGWSPIVGKIAVMSLDKERGKPLDQQIEFSIYLGGKLLKSHTTNDLLKLGARLNRIHSDNDLGDGAVFEARGCEQIPGTNDYVFSIIVAENTKLSFDILTGELFHKK